MIEFVFLAHMFYEHACCSNKDCHPVPCKEIVDTGAGWRWQRHVFGRDKLKISQDGACHVCVGVMPMCIYLPSDS